MDELHQRIANLSPEKRALLEQRLLQQSALRTREQSIPRRQMHSSYPLSFAQQRLWFLAQLDPDGAAYHVSKAVRIRGCLSIATLQQTLDAIVARHEALRTTIAAVHGNPMQVVQEQRTVPLDVRELCGLDEGERETALACQLTREAQRCFNLATDVMLRATLFHLEPEEYVLFLVMHHIASDGWSMGVLIRELGAFYRAFATGEAPTLSPLPIQYADYAIWQRQWLQGEVLAAQIAYWTQQLSGAPAVLELPTDFPRPAVQTSCGRRHSLTISAAVTEALKGLSRREGATLFMTMFAAWQVLLYRYTGQADISVGTPIAGRIRTETEPLIGFFVNTLVLRTDLTGDPTFRELLRRVREVAMGAYAHQELPFEKLVEALQPERNLSHTPLFQVMFAFQNVPRHTLELPGLVLTPLEVEHATAQFDMSLSLWEANDGLVGSLEYNTDLFAAETMHRLIGHFSTLLAGIVGDPNQRLSRLPLITAAEQHQMLVTWNATQAAPTSGSSLPGLLDSQAARTPTAVAVEAGEGQLTYEALHWRANQVARYLQKLGVGPEVRVALYMHRSLDMIIGLLGIVKAGGTYVPLDPAIPAARLAFIIDDAAVAVVLTQQALAERLPRGQAQVVCLDTAGAAIALENEQPCDSRVAGEHGAYIIYTSGTTGIPKGVLIAQQSIVNYVEAAAAVFALGPADRVLQYAAITFDVAAEEIFCCLSRGATLVLRTDAMVETVATFIQRCWDWRLTVLDLPTAYWHELATQLAETSLALPPTVRLVIIGGEKARREKLDLWWKRVGAGVRLVNGYGPTETTIAPTLEELTPTTEGALAGREVSVGRPIAHMQAYVLDRWLQPRAVGIPGELYLGGVGLARGYVNQPALTAERFIPHPFSRHPGARLYKTGDMARYRADGCLEILGRVDDQVKVRGFRIELGEIETILATHPMVRQVVVVTQEDTAVGPRLVAYLVPQHASYLSAEELRAYVRQKLPEYMVPSTFVCLPALPLTPHGKIDRRALPAPEVALAEARSEREAPQDALELHLTYIWEQVLGVRPIGVQDNFFELGGHSLLAVRLFAQLEQVWQKRLPLATLFEAPTVRQLAHVLQQEEAWRAPWSALVALQPGGAHPPLFCVHAHGGEVLFYRALAQELGPVQPFYALQAPGLDRTRPGQQRIEEMAAHYLTDVRALQPAGPYFLGGYCLGALIAFEMAQLLHAQGQQVALLAVFDSYAPGTPQALPYARAWWCRAGRLGQLLSQHARNVCLLPPPERHAYMRQRFDHYRWRFEREVLQRPLPASLRAGHANGQRAGAEVLSPVPQPMPVGTPYVPKPYAGRISLFQSRVRLLGYYRAADLGWGRLAADGVDTYMIPGHEGAMFYPPHVRHLAKQLQACLVRARTAAHV